MTIDIIDANQYGSLSEERLFKLEHNIGNRLPADYRAFLKHYNGGRPVPNGFWIVDGRDGSGIHQFYGLHGGPEWLQLDSYTNAEWGIPKQFLPIGDDGVGSLICIVIQGAERGAIYFIDHERHPYQNPDSFEGVTKLAYSFSEFLSILKSLPE